MQKPIAKVDSPTTMSIKPNRNLYSTYCVGRGRDVTFPSYKTDSSARIIIKASLNAFVACLYVGSYPSNMGK